MMVFSNCSVRSLRQSFALVAALLMVLTCGVSGARFNSQAVTQKKIITSFCNIEFKHTFIDPDFTVLSNSPIVATKDIQAICPFTKFSCCTANELRDVTARFMTNMQVLTQYFGKIKRNLGRALNVDDALILQVFETATAQLKEDDPVTNAECSYGFYGSKARARKVLVNLHRDIQWSLREIDNVRNLIQRFYSGFACSVCDLADHQFVEVNDKSKATSMTFDPNICDSVFRIRLKHYRVAKAVLRVFDIVNSLLCMSKRSRKNFLYFHQIRQELEKKTAQMNECASHSENDMNELSEKCLSFCGEKLFFQMYIDNFDLLTLSNFVKTFMSHVSTGKLTKDAQREIQHSLYFAVDFSFKESSKRRIFHLHQPKFQNLFSNEKFKRKFRTNAINFLNKAPILADQ